MNTRNTPALPYRLAGAVLLLLALAACGMKGPLYHPDPPPPADEALAAPPSVTPAPAPETGN